MAVPLNMTTPIVVNMDLYGCLVFLTCSVVFTVSRFILLKPSVNNPSYQTQQSLRCYDMPSFGEPFQTSTVPNLVRLLDILACLFQTIKLRIGKRTQ